MRPHLRTVVIAACGLAFAWAVLADDAKEVRLQATTQPDIEQVAGPIDTLIANGDLRFTAMDEDTILPGRHHQRLAQYYKGVPVWGAEVVRQLDSTGAVRSIFGVYHTGIVLDVTPRLGPEAATSALASAGVRPLQAPPTLAVLPKDGKYILAYTVAGAAKSDVRQYFVDAGTGAIVHDYTLIHKDGAAVGSGTGVLNDREKMSVNSSGSTFLAQDLLRPAQITTSDMDGNPSRTNAVLVGSTSLTTSDLADDPDNTWTDGPVVDAHAFAGLVYDYYFKRHGRHSWNSADGPIRGMVHPVRLEDFNHYASTGQLNDVIDFYANAFFCCGGSLRGLGGFMVYGEGVPSNSLGIPRTRPFSAGLDVVAHEMTHGMTAFTSRLENNLEAGALNESFSDQMGVAVDFYFRPQQANYTMGEDVVPGGFRSMSNPEAFGDADHVSVLRPENFEVHSLASLSNYAYYLAIEGGTNRVSHITVQGVGGANREQIEKVFYRAYQFMLGPDAFYCQAVAASILSARELYGSGSRPDQAVGQAWTAVGLVDFCFGGSVQ
jgi:Zn-dependent metalloprotease